MDGLDHRGKSTEVCRLLRGCTNQIFRTSQNIDTSSLEALVLDLDITQGCTIITNRNSTASNSGIETRDYIASNVIMDTAIAVNSTVTWMSDT